MAQFLPPHHDAGDANTIGGYQAVHGRPAAFEGRDGASYSVEIIVDDTGDVHAPYAAYLFFVRWGHGDPMPVGHVETPYLLRGATETEARDAVGAMRLNEVKALLDGLLTPDASSSRPWYEAMQDEEE
jgi:hypothetical protein